MRPVLRTVGRPETLPAALLLAFVAADLLDGPGQSVLGLWVAVPLVAAFFSRPSTVMGYGLASTVSATLLGFYDHSYARALSPQVERIVVIALSGLFAVGMSVIRLRRERIFRATRLLADTVQGVLLPAIPRDVGAVHVATSYHAAAASARVGGDFFDVRAAGSRARMVIGDVRGKGLPAVRLASVILAAFRERFEERLDITDLLDDLNRAVVREALDSEEFATATVGEIGPDGVLTLAVAGHPPPLKVGPSGVELLECEHSGAALGMVDERPVAKHCEFRIAPGERVLFYTDGAAEARNPAGGFFPLEEQALATLMSGTLREGLRKLEAALSAWTGGDLRDDIAFVLIELLPVPGPAGPLAPPSRHEPRGAILREGGPDQIRAHPGWSA